MQRILILGGTRNLGHVTAAHLHKAGHHVTIANRGVTPDELPQDIERIRATRGSEEFSKSIGHRDFDVVVDLTTYGRADAQEAVETFRGRTGRYVFISSGQVYLVLENTPRPFRENQYDGMVMPAPRTPRDFDSWKYGVDKRDAEDVFASAWERERFPFTTLRLPMVASERDHYGRLQGYFARMLDGGPILIPDEKGLPIRHVYVEDVARFIGILCGADAGKGGAYNLSYGESLYLDDYLKLLEKVVGKSALTKRFPRAALERNDLLPDCSPFSGTWMSELDASGVPSLAEFSDFAFRSPESYLPEIFQDYTDRWVPQDRIPATYLQRDREVEASGQIGRQILPDN